MLHASEPSKRSRETTLTLLIFLLGYPPSYLLEVLFARWLGPEDYGDFSVTFSVATIVGIIALLGFDGSALKFLAIYKGPQGAPQARRFVLYSLRTVLLTALAISVLGWLAIRLVEVTASVDEHPLRHAMFLVLPASMAVLLMRLLVGFGRTVPASFIFKILLPVSLVALGALLNFSDMMSENGAVWVHIGARLLLIVLMGGMLWHILRTQFSDVQPRHVPSDESSLWRITSRSFLITALASTLVQENGTLVLEALHSTEAEVGIYGVTKFTAAFPTVVLTAVQMVAIPRLSRLLEEKDSPHLTQELGRNLRILGAVGIGAVIVWSFWGNAVLALSGTGFESGHITLIVLGVGYCFSLVLGLASPMLQLRGEHRVVLRSTIGLVLLNTLLALALVPAFGMLGAALAFTISVATVYTFQALWLEKRLGITYWGALLGRR